MSTKRFRRPREHNKERLVDAVLVLTSGHDFFSEFREPEDAEELRQIWKDFSAEILEQHIAQDSTTRPAAFSW